MAQVGEVFVCPRCGNEVTVTKSGGNPEIHCCGQAMDKKQKNTQRRGMYECLSFYFVTFNKKIAFFVKGYPEIVYNSKD